MGIQRDRKRAGLKIGGQRIDKKKRNIRKKRIQIGKNGTGKLESFPLATLV